MTIETETKWQDADRDIWRYEEHRGKRITIRADADYLNALEARAALADELAAALDETNKALQWVRDYVGGYEGLQGARGYPPSAEAAQKGRELDVFQEGIAALLARYRAAGGQG